VLISEVLFGLDLSTYAESVETLNEAK